MIKGIEAVSTHGGKDQEERDEAVMRFKKSDRADVLVATDVAAKGLDFPDVQQVINFDMPDEIENYVHRIGRTGRCGKTGVATTFINKSQDETILRDLKLLLKEARQRIPPVLAALEDEVQVRHPRLILLILTSSSPSSVSSSSPHRRNPHQIRTASCLRS